MAIALEQEINTIRSLVPTADLSAKEASPPTTAQKLAALKDLFKQMNLPFAEDRGISDKDHAGIETTTPPEKVDGLPRLRIFPSSQKDPNSPLGFYLLEPVFTAEGRTFTRKAIDWEAAGLYGVPLLDATRVKTALDCLMRADGDGNPANFLSYQDGSQVRIAMPCERHDCGPEIGGIRVIGVEFTLLPNIQYRVQGVLALLGKPQDIQASPANSGTIL